MAATRGRLSRPHDWHSPEYVAEWIAQDEARDPVRRPRLREMLSAAPFPPDAPLAVLDVGAGFGAVTEELLQLFPAAQVTLQDYSAPMLAAARQRLQVHADQLRVVTADLTDPAWPAAVGGPFDLAVSAIVLHNLRDEAKIFACYRAIHELLRPGGWFLDYDLFFDGIDRHLQALREAGFATVECRWQEPPHAIVAAVKAAG
ncbi:MAG: class I SAM-dependent methyltransferase [Thiohalocapsa sp.]